jgi:hypothetical protein
MLWSALHSTDGKQTATTVLNPEDEDTPVFQRASKNSQLFAKRSVIALLLAR